PPLAYRPAHAIQYPSTPTAPRAPCAPIFIIKPASLLPSPRFPYTTLSRSHPPQPGRCDGRRHPRPPGRLSQPRPRPRAGRPWRGDRKSTRLNSSHVKNSYAVICSKKTKHEHKPSTEISLATSKALHSLNDY